MTKQHRLGKAWGRFLTRELLSEGYFKEVRDIAKISSYIKIRKPGARKILTPKDNKRKKLLKTPKVCKHKSS